jgi:hypothetical protein
MVGNEAMVVEIIVESMAMMKNMKSPSPRWRERSI